MTELVQINDLPEEEARKIILEEFERNLENVRDFKNRKTNGWTLRDQYIFDILEWTKKRLVEGNIAGVDAGVILAGMCTLQKSGWPKQID